MAKVEPQAISAELPAEAVAAIAGLGPHFNAMIIDATRRALDEACAGLVPPATRSTLDIAYGDHARQRLDVYGAAPEGEARPILIFIPGGGFVGGDKARYGSLGAVFAAAGFVTVVANYRLAPDVIHPSGSEDVASALAYVRDNATRFGGDARRIVLMGHSAGATHVATAVLDTDVQQSLVALVLASGLYQLEGRSLEAGVQQYFGTDESHYAARQVLGRSRVLSLPVLVFRGEHEPGNLFEDSGSLAEEWAAAGTSVRFCQFQGHNHISLVLGMHTPGHQVGAVVAEHLKNTIQAKG